MFPSNDEHTNKQAIERYKDEKKYMIKKSFVLDWDMALVRFFRKLFTKG